MITQRYPVAGMTCSHCVSAVSDSLAELPGVSGVSIHLVPAGTSTVTVNSDAPLDVDRVRDAVDEAGYELAEATS